MIRSLTLLLPLLALACEPTTKGDTPEGLDNDSGGADGTDGGGDGAGVDTDGDGYPDTDDCDPNDPNVYPMAPEIPYDGIDQDCYRGDLTDQDGDGYDALEVDGGTDCDDLNPAIHPDLEDPEDTFDNDCDGEVDEDALPLSTEWPVMIAAPEATVRGGGVKSAGEGGALGWVSSDSEARVIGSSASAAYATDGSGDDTFAFIVDPTLAPSRVYPVVSDGLMVVNDMQITDEGRLLMAGYYQETWYPDADNTALTRPWGGSDDGFFASYDLRSTELDYGWTFSSAAVEQVAGIEAVGGEVLLGLNFGTVVNANPGGPPAEMLLVEAAGGGNALIGRFDNRGALVWHSVMAGLSSTDQVRVVDVATSDSGSLLVLGTLVGSMTTAVGGVDTTYVASGVQDLFVAEVDVDTGAIGWLHLVGTPETRMEPMALRAHPDGPLVVGRYGGIAFGLEASGGLDGMLIQLDGSGAVSRVATLSTSADDVLTGVEVLPTGLALVGYTAESGTIARSEFALVGGQDCVLANLDADWNASTVRVIGGDGDERCLSSALGLTGEVYVMGDHTGLVDFGEDGASILREPVGPSGAFLYAWMP